MIDYDERHQNKLLKDYELVWEGILERSSFEERINHHIFNRKKYYEVIIKYLKLSKKPIILELGCGTSIDLNIIAHVNQGALCFGSDILKKSIFLSIKIRDVFENKIEYFVSDVRDLPIKKNLLISFSTKVSWNILEIHI